MRKHIFYFFIFPFSRFFVFYAFFRNTGLFKFIGLRKYAKTAKLCENILWQLGEFVAVLVFGLYESCSVLIGINEHLVGSSE